MKHATAIALLLVLGGCASMPSPFVAGEKWRDMDRGEKTAAIGWAVVAALIVGIIVHELVDDADPPKECRGALECGPGGPPPPQQPQPCIIYSPSSPTCFGP